MSYSTVVSKYTSEALAYAEQNGLDVILPNPNQLFVDIDSEDALAIFVNRVGEIRKWVDLDYLVNSSPSGRKGHYHIYVTLTRNITSENERILLQLLLGSDPSREVMSWARVVAGNSAPTLFFEKKEEIEIEQKPLRVITFEDEKTKSNVDEP